ncbi:MAG: VWA domain-containing protein [Candidatus Hodarchaeota archaeon]
MFSGITFDLVGNIFIFILLLICFITLSIFVYRKTNPPVATGLRRLLISLRIISLFIIILILFEPLLSITWNRIQKPIIAILIDTSASMSLTDAKVSRSQETNYILKQSLFQDRKKDYAFDFFQFSDNLKEVKLNEIDSLQFSSDGTDITYALQKIKEKMDDKNFAAVVLFSDGNYNIGENPVRYAQDYGVPIFPIAIGDPAEQKDVVISKVATNRITYADSKVPVDVTIKATGYKGKKVSVNLKKADKSLDSKFVELADNEMETKITLHYTPGEVGNHKYSLQIPALEDELTSLNNNKNFYVKVLKSKMKLLLIAGSPSFDFNFLKHALNEDLNIETTYWVLKNNRQFYEGNFPTSKDKLKNYDCIILLDFPRKNSPPQVLNSLKNLLETENKPLLLIVSKDLYFNTLRPLQNYLPFDLKVFHTNEQLVTFNLTSQGLQHPLMRLSDNDIENQNKWHDLPPIYYSFRTINLLPGSISLLEVNRQQSKIYGTKRALPIITVRKVSQQKSLAILGYGIWRWDFLMKGIGKTNDTFKQFLGNCIRWLVTREDSKLVRIIPDKEIYRSGEKVSFTAETYYEDYRPLDGAEIKLVITGISKEYQVTLADIGDGKYEGEFQVLEGGDYTYKGQAFYQNRLLGEDAGRFSVEEFSMEFIDTKMNEALLQQIAFKSGGQYFTSLNFNDLEKEINFPERNVSESSQWEIWNRLGLLIAVIVLLSVEWFIRKKKGML